MGNYDEGYLRIAEKNLRESITWLWSAPERQYRKLSMSLTQERWMTISQKCGIILELGM